MLRNVACFCAGICGGVLTIGGESLLDVVIVWTVYRVVKCEVWQSVRHLTGNMPGDAEVSAIFETFDVYF